MADYMECPLHWLVISDDYYDQFEARLKHPNEVDVEGNTLLHAAAMSSLNNDRIVHLLLQKGAVCDLYNPDWMTPVHFAVASRNRFALVHLIEDEANVDTEDKLGRTPLHLSVFSGQLDGPTPLDIAECDMWIVENLLCNQGIDLNPIDDEGETPLVWAIKEKNLDAFKALLRKGANPDIPDKDKRNSLHVALSAETPCDFIVFELFERGTGIYRVDNSQLTPIDLLLRNVRDDSTLSTARHCVRIIAFRHHVAKSLKRKLKQVPSLRKLLKKCRKEVRLMKELIIYDKLTLHDFCLDCIQKRFRDAVREIYIPVIEILLSGLFIHYRGLILSKYTESDLRHVLVKTAGRVSALDLIPPGASKDSILLVIKGFYDEDIELKRRLSRFDHLLRK